MRTPPPIAERLPRWSVRDADWRDAITGDLREEFADLVRRRGAAAADRWYWRHAVVLTARFAIGRVVPAAAPRRPLAFADDPSALGLGAGWSRELGHAWRAVSRRRGLSAVIVISVALALAANATIFNLADALYLRPFRMPDVDRLVIISASPEGDSPFFDPNAVAPADFRDWMREATTVEGLAAGQWWDPNLSGRHADETPEQLAGFRVSPTFLGLLGAHTVLGRGFTSADEVHGQHRVVLIGHGLWQRRFGADPGVVGRTIRVDGETQEVIGVMPPGFSVPYGAEIWAPLGYSDDEWAERRRAWLLVVGRLKDAHTLAAAQAEFDALVAQQAAAFPDTNARRRARVVTFSRGMGDPAAGPFLAIWQAAAVLLLLIACANVANLLLARGRERQQELAVRLALGASRGRLVAQMLLEGIWLAVLSVGAALPLAWLGVTLTRDFLPASIIRFVPGYQFIQVDAAALALLAGLAAVAAVLFSLVPALHASRAAVVESLKQSGRTLTPFHGRHWLGSALAAAQVALAVALVVAASLTLRAVDGAINGELGFDKRNMIVATLTLPDGSYESADKRRQFVDTVLERLRALPAVRSVGAASTLPYTGFTAKRPFHPEGVLLQPGEVRFEQFVRVTPEYLATMGVPLVDGRPLGAEDRSDTRPVALVSQSLADRYWPGDRAVGRRFRLDSDGPWIEVVGVVGDLAQDWFLDRRAPTIYRPIAQDPSWSLAITARTVSDPAQVAGPLRRAVAAADPDQPTERVMTMDEVIGEKVAGLSYLSRALAIMSGIALVLSLMGVYSLIAYLAARRTQEMGVRVALGATRWQVIGLNLRQATAITVVGLGVGTALAVGLGRLMATALFGLVSLDAARIAATVLALGVVALAAAYVPARRAAGLSPTDALRTP
ncbi:MAG: ADOP family duplicated permease [Acidobacteriota bacterium]